MSVKPLSQSFTDDVDAVVDKYRDQGITVSEVVGALELVKIGIINSSIESDEDHVW